MTSLALRRRGDGPPLVFVHGYLGGSAMWAHEIARFSRDFDVIAPDLPGFGDSHELAAVPSIDGQARAVLERLSELGIERFKLVGHSMGGMIVQQMAALAPARVERLVLYGTGPLGSIPGRFETMERSRERLREDGVEATVRRIAATWFVGGDRAAGYAATLEQGLRAGLDAALAGLTAMEGWDGRAALAGLRMPTLIVWGDRDRTYTWPQVEALWRGIDGAALAVVPDAAHNVHQEAPELFGAIVARFLGSR